MRLMRQIPRLGILPELYSYYCAPCGEYVTQEGTRESGGSSHQTGPRIFP